jgi:hypothetical protein
MNKKMPFKKLVSLVERQQNQPVLKKNVVNPLIFVDTSFNLPDNMDSAPNLNVEREEDSKKAPESLRSKSINYDGADICRLICSIFVMCVHFQPNNSIFLQSVAPLSSGLRTRFFIAVFCFFLARSMRKATFSGFWRGIKRLLVPYTFWSLIYFVLRAFSYSGAKRSNYLQNFASEYLLGNTAVQLYFIPMVISASIVLFTLHYFIFQRVKFQKIQNPLLWFIAIVISIPIRNQIVGGYFSYVGRNQFELVLTQYLEWAFAILPFLTMGYFLSNLRVQEFISRNTKRILVTGSIVWVVLEVILAKADLDWIATTQSLVLLVTVVSMGAFPRFAPWRHIVRELSVIIFFTHAIFIEGYQHLKIWGGFDENYTGKEAILVIVVTVISAFLIFRYIRPHQRLYYLLTGRAPHTEKGPVHENSLSERYRPIVASIKKSL